MPFDSFLNIVGIPGDSTDKNHPREIVVESFNWAESNVGTKAAPQDFHFTMAMSSASPNLMLACATARTFPSATLTCRRAGGPGQLEFLRIILADVVVSSFQTGAHLIDSDYSLLGGSEQLPTDQATLSFDRIDFTYTVASTGETVETAFDFSAGR